MVLSVAGNTGILDAVHRAQSLDGTAVTVLVNGVSVANGTLDASGRATIALPSTVPSGATVEVEVGSHTFSATLTNSSSTTDVSVQINDDGSATVSMSDDANPAVDAAIETEDQDGNPIVLNSGSQATLPSNLPIVVSLSCTSIIVAPATGVRISRLVFEEKSSDSDQGDHFKYDGVLNGPVTFTIDGSSERVHVLVFGDGDQLLFEMTAPIGVFTPLTTTASPTPLCSRMPIPPEHPTWHPTGFPSWHPEPHPTERATASPEAHPSPEATESAAVEATPTARATSTVRPSEAPSPE